MSAWGRAGERVGRGGVQCFEVRHLRFEWTKRSQILNWQVIDFELAVLCQVPQRTPYQARSLARARARSLSLSRSRSLSLSLSKPYLCGFIHVAKETYSFIQRDLLRELMRLEQQPTRCRV
jgi:hypothetical protein